eukprot:GHVT01102044.1.p2 GENE.GHVT01102044.1~~GHVT01102044.1.p2  ORF type:complete len:171 (+),score=23.05 GHVT01102044.1:1619-2131(+)
MRPHTAAATTVPSSIPAGVRRPRTAAEMSLPPEDDMSVAAAPAGDGAEVDEAPLDEYNEPRLASCSESLAILLEISNILNTGLDRQTLTILLQLLDTVGSRTRNFGGRQLSRGYTPLFPNNFWGRLFTGVHCTPSLQPYRKLFTRVHCTPSQQLRREPFYRGTLCLALPA